VDADERLPRAADCVGTVDTFLVECFWPGVTRGHFESAASLAGSQSTATCLELILIPEDEIVLGVFRGASPAAVSEACRFAGLPDERIVEAVEVRPVGR
jgi:hypothetical protein